MRYVLRRTNLEHEDLLRLYHAFLAWGARNSDHFELGLNLGDYAEPDRAARLTALGTATEMPAQPTLLGRMLGRPELREVRVTGTPGESFVRELSTGIAPSGAISGDECPAEDLRLMRSGRTVYAIVDYGRDQLFDVTEDELAELRAIVIALGYESDILEAWSTDRA